MLISAVKYGSISTQRDKYFNIYGGPDGFVGMEHTLHTGNSETDWRVAVLLPMEHYNQYVSSSRRWLLGGFVLIFAGLLAAAFWMSQKYVRPITESLAALQAGQMDAPSIGIDPAVMLYRGIPELARKNGLQLHNRWNLEFDMEYLPEARLFLNTQIERLADSYCWTQRVHLKDTWEDALLLCVPVADVGGNVYGVCGFEVSALYFQLSFPVVETN